ncbi:MAG: hypothetical protein AAB336_12465 [Acidobacteriota bacterium]
MIKLKKNVNRIAKFSMLLMVVSALVFCAVPTVKAQTYVMRPFLQALDVNTVAGDDDNIRNGAIVFLSENSKHTVSELQGTTNADLTEMLRYAFYLRFRGTTKDQMKAANVYDMRNGVIVNINRRKGIDVPTLQGMSAYDLVNQDGINANSIESGFNQPSSVASYLDFTPSTTECSAYNTAKSRVPDLEQRIASLRSDYNQVIGLIETILSPLRKVPGALWVARKNPFFQIYENKRKTKLNAIINAEHNLFAALGIMNNYTIVSTCRSCQDERENKEKANASYREFGAFVDFIQAFREGLNAASSPVAEEQAVINQMKIDIDDFNSVMFKTFRAGWDKRNQSLPQCG